MTIIDCFLSSEIAWCGTGSERHIPWRDGLTQELCRHAPSVMNTFLLHVFDWWHWVQRSLIGTHPCCAHLVYHNQALWWLLKPTMFLRPDFVQHFYSIWFLSLLSPVISSIVFDSASVGWFPTYRGLVYRASLYYRDRQHSANPVNRNPCYGPGSFRTYCSLKLAPAFDIGRNSPHPDRWAPPEIQSLYPTYLTWTFSSISQR